MGRRRSSKKLSVPIIDIKEKLSVKEVRDGNVQQHLLKLTELLTSKLNDKSVNDSNNLVLRLIVSREKELSSKPVDVVNQVEDAKVVQNLENSLQDHLAKKAKILKELPKKLEELKKAQEKGEPIANANVIEDKKVENNSQQSVGNKKKNRKRKSGNHTNGNSNSQAVVKESTNLSSDTNGTDQNKKSKAKKMKIK